VRRDNPCYAKGYAVSIIIPSLLAGALILGPCSNPVSATSIGEEKMKRIHLGSLIKVRPEYEERYIILHRHTFPGVLSRIRASNIRNYSIFLRDGVLFSHLEYIGKNFDSDMKAIADTVTRDWWKLTDPMQEPFATRKEGEWWASMDLVLHRDGATLPRGETGRAAFVAGIAGVSETTLREMLGGAGRAAAGESGMSGIRNLNLYVKDGKVYAYFEYAVKGESPDVLWRAPGVKQWLRQIGASLDDPTVWEPMREVFHTN
jgi:L-rhamnose mutarotase